MGDLKKMFNPKSIALIGASEKEGSPGRLTLENLLLSKERKIFPVNPNRKTVLGLSCHPTILDVPGHIDLVIILTPAHTVPQCVEECGRAGVEGIIIVSSGFREIGEEGKRLEDEIIAIRKQYGVRIIGPNCQGIIRPNINLNTSFLKPNPEPGNIAFISQSGQLGDAIVDWGTHAHVGFSMFASLGSMIDVDFGDLVDFLGDDYDTRSIMIYMENVGDARKFLSAAKGFARNKPMVILKPGIFEESARAVVSHTGAMAGSDRVYDAAFKRVGLVRVKEVADLFNMAEVLDSSHLPRGPRLAIITNAGGVGIIATDTLLSLGGKLAKLTDESMERLHAVLPPHWSKSNPVDILGDADIARYTSAMDICIGDPNVDGLLVIHAPRAIAQRVELARAVVECAQRVQKPIVCTRMGGRGVKDAVEFLVQHNIPIYDTPEEAVKTYLYMYKYKRNLELMYETPSRLSVAGKQSPKFHLKALIRKAMREDSTILNEEESVRFLKNYAIPTVRTLIAQTVEEALRIAKDMGYPVVLKIASPDISHKTDVHGVITGIDNEKALKEAYKGLLTKIRETAPGATRSGVIVQKMLEKIDYEIIIGSKKDRDFGSIIIFGMGGIGTRIFKDFSVGLPPLNQILARRIMEETEVYTMLQGYRGKPAADLRQLEEILVNFSNLITDFPEIAEMDINPIAISDGKAYALDAGIVLDRDVQDYSSPRSYPHLAITPYPTGYIMPWTLPDGTEVLMRPIMPEDEPLEHEMLTTLSEQTLKERFFTVIEDITHEMLIRFCNIDYEREMAIVTEIREGNTRKIVGIGRLIVEPDFKSGQFAVLVHDSFQGKGLGFALIDMMIGIAQEKGLDEIYGIVLSENERMLKICRKLGFSRTLLPDGISRVTLRL
ncbi:bifunctional acetate--CoA ligase family protein/GNAT family N-acetyltransferase [Syntrophorhabdus aromaticivorans]|uniref:GNAT family N-acetyltransferase n=1 Tax=Syntrophorhabdus aromaticivorans TaxID=328301 RepID=A0A971M1P8_9BACT|nr:bifunctional acetyl coenzyme A synthetase (ADP forming), alpha domain/GNAT family N-acetyltransferase [Syntrophorhabdus aromaticivorans]NLW34103.1 GNAT family N-acetyltransferase [Syntrophorhabdus aromaticivorans]